MTVGQPEDDAQLYLDLEADGLTALVGVESDEQVELERSGLSHRRIFVSNPNVAGRSLGELQTLTRFGALVTRLRRGDVDLARHRDPAGEDPQRHRRRSPGGGEEIFRRRHAYRGGA